MKAACGGAASSRRRAVWPLSLLVPDEWTTSVADVDPARLEAAGIRCLLVDIDNTLVAWGAGEVDGRALAFVEACRRHGLAVVLLSNARRRRRTAIASALGVPVGMGLKPRRGSFVRAARSAGFEPRETAVVGDQLWTDVLGGRRAGMYTVLVNPLSRREHLLTRLGRLIERWVLWLLGVLGAAPEEAVRRRLGCLSSGCPDAGRSREAEGGGAPGGGGSDAAIPDGR